MTGKTFGFNDGSFNMGEPRFTREWLQILALFAAKTTAADQYGRNGQNHDEKFVFFSKKMIKM